MSFMWRITQRISKNSQTVKVQCINRGRIMCTQASKQPESKNVETADASPPPPPPPPPKKSGFFWKFVGVSIVGAGGVIGYAWFDSGFRNKLEENVPYSKDFFSYIFHFVPPPVEQIKSQEPPPSLIKRPVPAITSDQAKLKETEKVQQVKKSDVTEDEKRLEMKKQEADRKMGEVKKHIEQEKAKQALQKIAEDEAAKNRELEFVLDRLHGELKKSIEAAVAAQKSAAEAIKGHTKKLKSAMESTSTEAEWEAVLNTQQLRADAVWTADTATERAKQQLDKLRSTVTDGKANQVTKKNKVLLSTEEEMNKLNYLLGTSTTELGKAQSEAKVVAEYRDLVKKGKERFKKELESILPDVKSGQKLSGGHLTEDELNSLIAHAHRRIDQLQKQLAEQQVMEQQRIEQALGRQKEEDEKLAEKMVSQEKEQTLAEMQVLKQKWDNEAHIEFEKELRSQLARQAAAHSDHIVEVVKVQQKELEGKFLMELNEHIQTEREHFQKQVAGWVARLRGIETAIDKRAELEKEGRKAQQLWLACQSLQSAVDHGKESRIWEEQLKPLKAEVTAIREAVQGSSSTIETVLDSIPDAALSRGVWTEMALIERFEKVNRICRRVAMIDETGASFFKFFLSYVQSFFVFRSSRVFSEFDQVDFQSVSTFALLDNARYCLEHGDLEQAVRYVNQLRGEPRRVACDWLLEARLRLETKQAADVLLAYASATGLGSLF